MKKSKMSKKKDGRQVHPLKNFAAIKHKESVSLWHTSHDCINLSLGSEQADTLSHALRYTTYSCAKSPEDAFTWARRFYQLRTGETGFFFAAATGTKPMEISLSGPTGLTVRSVRASMKS